jgi:hypothetical protein
MELTCPLKFGPDLMLGSAVLEEAGVARHDHTAKQIIGKLREVEVGLAGGRSCGFGQAEGGGSLLPWRRRGVFYNSGLTSPTANTPFSGLAISSLLKASLAAGNAPSRPNLAIVRSQIFQWRAVPHVSSSSDAK